MNVRMLIEGLGVLALLVTSVALFATWTDSRELETAYEKIFIANGGLLAANQRLTREREETKVAAIAAISARDVMRDQTRELRIRIYESPDKILPKIDMLARVKVGDPWEAAGHMSLGRPGSHHKIRLELLP